MVQISAGYYFPAGDLADRFGASQTLGGSYIYKMRSNFFFSGNFHFLLGSDVKENVLEPILASSGYLITTDGLLEIMQLQQRGFLAEVQAGKIFPIFGPNPNSGLALSLGAGLLQHQIHFNYRSQYLPQLEGDYEKGYDRLTNGLSLSQSIGYLHLNNTGLVNYHISLVAIEAFTENRRSFNFDEQRNADEQRLDVMLGLRVAWILPIYRRAGDEFFY